MENGVNSYLHKKFKKQLSIEYCKQIVQLDKENEVKNREEPLQNIIQVANPVKHQNGYLEAAPIANQFEGPPCQSEVIVDNLENVPNQKIVQVKTSSISNNDLINLKNSISNSQKFQDEFNKMYAPKITTSSITMSSFIPEPERPIETTEIKQDKQSTNSGSGKYICNYCNLACSKPSVLQKHIRAHTNERPYPCVSCGFSFKTRSNLYKHCRSRTHANRVLGNTNSNKTEENDCDSETMQMLNISDLQADNDNQSKSSKVYKPRFHPPVHTDSDETINIEPQDILSHHINEIITKKSDFRSYPTYELNQDEPLNLSTATNVGRQSPPQLSPIKVIMSPIRDIYEPKSLPRNGTTDYAKIWAQGHFDERFSNQGINSPNSSPNIVLQSAKNDLSVISQNKHNAANIAKNYSNEYDYYQERLNHLTARKRSNSEAPSPKSVIKELLLKNLSSSDNMQCPHCKMLFQTVTELELHKLRSCKGFVKPGAKYTRSSSVNVASILHQDKNAFAYSPQMSSAVFPLKSPGPFLGKTRLVESDKTKSFSCDESFQQSYRLSPISFQDKKVQPVKLFGGEVQITTNEDKSFKIDDRDTKMQNNLSENTVVKSSLQSGGTVLTNKVTYEKNDMISANSSFSIYPPASNKLLHNGVTSDKNKKKPPDLVIKPTNEFYPYPNIVDFSQNAVRLLTPNLKQPNMIMTASPMSVPKFSFTPTTEPLRVEIDDHIMSKKFMLNPLSICVDGKMVPHVPGMPGPIQTVDPIDFPFHPKQLVSPASFQNLISPNRPKNLTPSEAEKYHLLSPSEHHLKEQLSPNMLAKNNEILRSKIRHRKLSPNKTPTNVLVNNNNEVKKFARPNSLALKPTTASLKQNHGLTPTMFNQILISPDTPRVAKKYVQQFLNGNYFSYLGLKSTTKPVYCTLNKTQPFYVPHFKKLSMYSEWRQQDTKNDKLYVSGFDSRQRNSQYSVAGSKGADLIVHSTYKFVASEVSQSQSSDKNEDAKNQNGIAGGYESNEDYTYIRGRGRGRYVCEQCGIRCKKPSMLKKHIRTHSNDRPYTCSHCNFSFKTKGNLTKHMKSKAHTKNYTASNSSNSSNQQSTPSSDSDTDDSGMDSSDESSTRQQEHEAAYGLLSLSQKSQPLTFTTNNTLTTSPSKHTHDKTPLMNSEEIFIVTQTNFAKNKMITDKMNGLKFDTISTTISELRLDEDNKSNANHDALGKINNSRRPLTYPYTTILPNEGPLSSSSNSSEKSASSYEPEVNIRQFNVIKQYITDVKEPKKDNPSIGAASSPLNVRLGSQVIAQNPIIKVNDSVIVTDSTCDLRKRNFTDLDTPETIIKRPKNDLIIMDLSKEINNSTKTHNLPEKSEKPITNAIDFKNEYNKFLNTKLNIHVPNKESSVNFTPEQLTQTPQQSQSEHFIDTTAMETLADVATKQEKLEKNSIAKNVASEFLKLATKNEGNNDELNAGMRLAPLGKEVNDMMVKSEGSKSCTICSKSFSKPSQLRLHMNIHYLERPYRCDSCSVSFRTKGHLQKHERSASHNSKLSSSPALSSSEPRPFKCSDCNIAFRIHGHLAKHLRSKMHIMKLECLAKIPFGLYAELERSNSLLTEINTADGDQCLESLKTLAQKVFMNDPTKLNHLVNSSEMLEVD